MIPRYRNQLLSSLDSHDLDRIAPMLQRAEMAQRQILERANELTEYVYFPESGIASIVAIDGANRRMEAGPFGRDGMSGLCVVLDAGQSPHETSVQIPGHANRVRADDLRQLLSTSPAMHRRLLHYAHAFAVQTAHTALAAGLSVVEKRLARWILMLHDRIDGDDLLLTHDFMAFMLAVRRPGVTVALHVLEGHRMIRSLRGRVIVTDRAALEAFCEGLYGIPEAEYARLIGPIDRG